MSFPSASALPIPPGAHRPLSESLREILDSEPPPGGLTLNTLFARTQGRGVFLFIILLCLPFLAPVSLPGLSMPVGTVIMILAWRLGFGLAPRLPAWIGEKPLPPKFDRVLNGSIRVLRFVERWLVRPRRTRWLNWRAARRLNGLVLALMGFYLALPLAVPFTNTVPAYAIVLLALSMMEQDGVLIWLGYSATLAALLYLVAVADLAVLWGLEAWARGLDWVRGWL
jgi:hypothetical protein